MSTTSIFLLFVASLLTCFLPFENLVLRGMRVLKVAFVSLLFIHVLTRASSFPCSPQETSWVVEDPAGASALASFTNCSGGIFDVEWRGHVEFPSTLFITDGSFLNITGAGTGAVADGGGNAQFLVVVESVLHVSGLRIENCSAEWGGGVSAVESVIAFNETSFSGNTGSGWGGALYVAGSNISWSGETSFTGNTAGERGGALYAEESDMSWSGDTRFSGNAAVGGDELSGTVDLDGGGAMYVYSSSASWSGEANFSGNTAGRWGGALCFGESQLSWSGETIFSDNFGEIDGGALYVFDSIVSWSGETIFSDNAVWGYGSALEIIDSTVSWSGETRFTGNDGDPLLVINSTVSWSGKTNFSGNYGATYGDTGGALSVWDDSNVFWSGKTTFSGNVGSSGGALHVRSSNVSWSGDTSFAGNTAENGGALYMHESSFVSWEGRTSFSRNTASSSGGAVALVGAASTLSGDGAVFEGNMAELSGGAVYTSGVSIGSKFTFTKFTVNISPQGGAVYSASSGTYEDEYSRLRYPTTYENCTFTDNWASSTGGAIESVAGLDRIENTYFARNSAGAGGALRLGGSTDIRGCTFIDNVSSEDEGAAISNVGTLTVESNNFTGNAFWCEPGTFRNWTDATEANITRYERICDGCPQLCVECEVEDKYLVPVCSSELEHTQSEGGGTTIETLKLYPGYWRATNKSDKILACYNEEACLGGVTGAPSFCQTGYEGQCEERVLLSTRLRGQA